MVKKLTFIWIALLFCQYSFSQNLTASVSANKITLDQTFELTFTANGKMSSFNPPDLSDFIILSGPNQSTSIQMINGNFSQSISYSYILKPRKAGTFTIGPAEARVNGKKVNSNTIQIEVLPSGQKPSTQNQPQESQKREKSIDEKIKDNIFIKALVSKSSVFEGEQIILTYKLYQRIELYQPQIKLPSYKGFWIEDINLKNIPATYENVNGVRYSVQTFKQSILIPQKTGTLTIEPLTIEGIVQVQTRAKRRSFFDFDDFFNDPFGFDPFGSVKNYPVTLKSNPITIKVKPLPQPQPPEFSGLVGNVNLSATANTENLKTGEPVTLKITVSGSGNLSILSPFELDLPSDIETYEPKTHQFINKNAGGISGSVSFEYLLIPQVKGVFKIPPVKLVYFNPENHKYITLTTDEILLHVTQGEEKKQNITLEGVEKREIELRGKDIQFIRLNTPSKPYKPFFGSLLFFILLALPVLLFIVFLMAYRWLQDRWADKVKLNQKKARKKALSSLKKAYQMLKKQDDQLFYDTIYKSINQYLINKLNINPASFTRSIALEKLKEQKVSEVILNDLNSLLDECEFNRYAPAAERKSNREIYDKALDVITRIEKELKK